MKYDGPERRRFTLSNWERFGPYVGLLIVLAFTVAAISMIQHDRGVRRDETTAQRAADLKLAKDAYLTSCAHENGARRALRNAIIGNANDLGRLILEAFPDEPTAVAFAKDLDDSAVSRANHDAPPITCVYPPKPIAKAGR